MANESQGKYTAEQIARFTALYQDLIEAEKRVEDYRTAPHLQHPVIKRKFAWEVLGDTIPNYEKQVPEDVRASFNFDIDGLVKRINELF